LGIIACIVFVTAGGKVLSYTSSDKYYMSCHVHPVQGQNWKLSTLTAIMGRTAAYTGGLITWDEILKSNMDLGPKEIKFGQVNMVFETPVPGTPVII
jgi:hypothetical protein